MKQLLSLLVVLAMLTVQAIPAISVTSTSVFTVYGVASLKDAKIPAGEGYSVSVQNLTTKTENVFVFPSGALGKYAVAFVDYSGNRAAAEGDILLITLRAPAGKIVGVPVEEIVSQGAVGLKLLRVDINSESVPVRLITWSGIKDRLPPPRR